MSYDVTPDHNLSGWAFESIDTVLRRRGHLVAASGDIRQTLFPQERLADIMKAFRKSVEREQYAAVFEPNAWERYTELFGRMSFRKVARQLIGARGQPVALSALGKVAGARAADHVAYLEALQVVQTTPEGPRLIRLVDDFGPSLEHYVSLLCRRELRGSAAWGVKLEELPCAGGDFDVLAWLPPNLVYIECKAGDPRNIPDTALRHFLQRTAELAPELAIYLVDTGSDLTLDEDARPGLVSRLNRIIRNTVGGDEHSPPPLRTRASRRYCWRG